MNWIWRRLNSRPKTERPCLHVSPICESTPTPRGLVVTSSFAVTIASTHDEAALIILQRYRT